MGDQRGYFNGRSAGDYEHDRPPHDAMEHVRTLAQQSDHVALVQAVLPLLEQYPRDIYLHMNMATSLGRLGEAAQEYGDLGAADHFWNASLEYALSGLKIRAHDTRLLN